MYKLKHKGSLSQIKKELNEQYPTLKPATNLQDTDHMMPRANLSTEAEATTESHNQSLQGTSTTSDMEPLNNIFGSTDY
jgi:hypothetical protein